MDEMAGGVKDVPEDELDQIPDEVMQQSGPVTVAGNGTDC
jgi:hypothetical protein